MLKQWKGRDLRPFFMHAMQPAVRRGLKRFRRRFGIDAPQLVVRSHIAWPWRLAALLCAGGLAIAVLGLFVQHDEAGLVGREAETLRQRVLEQAREIDRLRHDAGGDSAVSIERAAQQQLLARVGDLERENAALKEDVHLYERLLAGGGEEGGLRVESFRVGNEPGGKLRYRLLLAYQPTRQAPEFRGRLQLLVAYVLSGSDYTLMLPENAAVAGDYQVEVKRLLRREGFVDLPPGGHLKAIEARIFQGDILKSRETARFQGG